ncbi:sensor domain-containing diguanylate cyclase [Vibrio palustris]|uniref:diguanylate cyclase n=1 Tax=Vibrio palustris TaxID=1918946 RepID=A0A1R4B129_9VIBR|nr:sensor domain-containing diguanylate cyclase [Vibrio palustris]SJL82625.1 Phytochrome-like protein cph2 [Vibrio palustris]
MTKKTTANGDVSSPPKYYSLASIINIGIVTFICAILALSLATYSKLKTFENTITKISEQSLPNVIHSGNLYAYMNSLRGKTEQLTMANSEAMRRIAMGGIEQQISQAYANDQAGTKDSYNRSQLALFQQEIVILDELVVKKLTIKAHLSQQQKIMYQVRDDLCDYIDKLSNTHQDTPWKMTFANIIMLTGELLTVEDINLIRQQRKKLRSQFHELNTIIDEHNVALTPQKQEDIHTLHDVILAPETGIIALRIAQLKLVSKVRSRGNFVSNLISDYARLTEFQSFLMNSTVTSDASKTSFLVRKQIEHASLTFLSIFIGYIGFAIFIHYFIIKRLKKLRNQVQQRRKDPQQDITITGHDEITQLAQSFELYASTIEKQTATLKDMTQKDPLTGIANRRAFDEYYGHIANLCQRQQQSLAIMILDVDYFKQFNDNYGHVDGDRCLQQVANILSAQLSRQSDFVARYGGEEFIILLPDTSQEGAKTVANNILAAINQAQIPHLFSQVAQHLTISIGISVSHTINTHLVIPTTEEADQALYQAKGNGRNRWEMYSN